MTSRDKFINIVNFAWVLALAMAFFQIYTGGFGLLTAMLQRSIHLYFAMVLILLYYPLTKGGRVGRVVNYFLISLTLLVAAYMISFATPEQLAARALVGSSLGDIIVGSTLVLLVFEVTRRICGLPMTIIGLSFIGYAFAGPYLPSLLAHRGYSFIQVVEQVVYTHEGLWGTPLAVSSSFVILFVIFGAVLEKSGGGKFFIDLAFAATGRSRSGPALSAVVSSAFMGTINGVAAANVVTTGAFTIPLMKQVGYKPHVAGAVEAAASTGGQILPPVMGAAAFIMAEMMGVSYSEVALAAIIPALLYFISVGLMVHFEAVRLGLKGLSKENLPIVKDVMRDGWLFLFPIGLLIYLLVIVAYSPTKSALFATGLMLLIGVLRKKDRMCLTDVLDSLVLGVKNSLVVAAACATAGVVIGVVVITGLGLRFSNLIVTLSGGHLFLALILTAITCIILGMGLPTSAAYIITATLGVPALVNLGLEPMAAHLFVLYFAVVSVITPPVAIAGYAASAVAQSDPMRTSITATRFGIVAYVVPFMFAYGPALILIGSPLKIIIAAVTSLAGVAMIAFGIQGWMLTKAGVVERVAFLAAALLLINTQIMTDAIGISFAALAIILQLRKRHLKLKQEAQAGAETIVG